MRLQQYINGKIIASRHMIHHFYNQIQRVSLNQLALFTKLLMNNHPKTGFLSIAYYSQ